MPGTIVELQGSRTYSVSVTGGTATFLYYIHGETDEAAAYDLVLNESPEEWFKFTRSDINMNNRPTTDQWFPVVTYTLPVFGQDSPAGSGDASSGNPAPDSPSSSPPSPTDLVDGVAFSIGLENQHVTKSLETFSRHGLEGVVPKDFKGLIGVTLDGKVEGVDIGIPVASLTVKRTLPTMTAQYFKNLLYLAGKTNNQPWWIFQNEEGLFVGASGQQKGSGEFELNYEFKYSKSEVDIVIREPDVPGGEGLKVELKRGWHYLWVHYREELDATANARVERPFSAYVERVYPTADFNYLGI